MRLVSYLLFTPIIASLTSQTLKLVFNMIINKQKFKISNLAADGNYPSSHTAFMTSITAVSWFNTIAKLQLAANEEIWVWISVTLTVFWLITVRDALGVRYTVQKLCECVMDIVENTSKAEDIKAKLDIKSGHRPYEVIAGAILGLIVASATSCIYYKWYNYFIITIILLFVYIIISLLVLKFKRKK